MDKELPKSKMTVKPGKLFVKLSKSQLPEQKPFYKGTLPNHPTLTIEDIAARAVKARSSYRHGTFVEVFRTMIEEMYGAIHDGFNVDFGLGRTELTVTGVSTPLPTSSTAQSTPSVPTSAPLPV
ncbi:DNA-binding domain-containing protein [Parabacteroides goldsteinii]|uniref:DNA-binding domain-containing protein n=1 Tax=Parabacteroides goldsteinii TaxID=328812 RepID=UPI0036F1F099